MFLYDKPVYTEEEYKNLRRLNRVCFQKNPIEYCKNQVEWKPNYEIKIDNQVFYMEKWLDGLRYIKRNYNIKLSYLPSFGLLYFLGNKMPTNINYIICVKDLGNEDEILYSSHSCRFCLYIKDGETRIKDIQGSKLKIKEALERFI